MAPKNLALAASSGLIVLAILYLFVEVRKAPAQPSADKVEDARKRYQVTKASAPPSPANLSDPWARNEPTATTTQPPTTARIVPDQPPPPAESTVPEKMPPPESKAGGSIPDVANDPRLEMSDARSEAHRLFDKQEFESAIAIATKVLAAEPGDIRMLRILVSSHCAMGDADKAQGYWNELPQHDRMAMNRRCQKYGVTFKE